jgi:hypothetical protein
MIATWSEAMSTTIVLVSRSPSGHGWTRARRTRRRRRE